MPPADLHGPDASGTLSVSLSGTVDLRTLAQLEPSLASAGDQRRARRVVIHLEKAERLGPAVAAVLRKWAQADGALPLELSGAGDHSRVFELAPEPARRDSEVRPRPSPLARLGAASITGLARIGGMAADSLRIARVAGRSLSRTSAAPVGQGIRQVSRMAADALPIVGLLGALIGISFALQSATKLRAYGASDMLPDLLGLGVIRYLGPILTAVVVSGRSGAAVTSELGTMNVREETAALKMMGIDPWRYLGLPRFLGFVLAIPVLNIFASAAAVVAGLMVAKVTIGLPLGLSLDRLFAALTFGEIVQAITKTFVFGAAIGITAVSYGFSVRGGAEEIGKTTTKAVVQMILLIIIIDFLFAALITGLAL